MFEKNLDNDLSDYDEEEDDAGDGDAHQVAGE